MNLLLDYLPWRGDLPLECAPLCPVDRMLLAQLSYLHFKAALGERTGLTLHEAAPLIDALPRENGNPQTAQDRHTLLRQAAESARFGGMTILDCEDIFDEQGGVQFAAVTFGLPNGTVAIAFRGTDGTLVGWREDFSMSFECPVPAQAEAMRYVERVAQAHAGPLDLTGHSKGGNLAVYAGACCDPAVQERIAEVYTFDGPGLDAKTLALDGYRRVIGRVRSYVPQSSIVGMLMGIPEKYTVVRSNTVSGWQHNMFTWGVLGPGFVTLPQTDATSKIIKSALDEFLEGSTPQTRRLLVDTLFNVLGAASASGDSTLEWTRTASALFSATRALDPSTRKAVTSIVGQMFASGVEGAKRYLDRGDA